MKILLMREAKIKFPKIDLEKTIKELYKKLKQQEQKQK